MEVIRSFLQLANIRIGNFLGKASLGIPFVPVLWVLKNSFVVSLRIGFGTPNVPDLPRYKKFEISGNAYEYFDFPAVG
jgi:hypothetical protein